jgi:catechol 2,3-dioxygenase-like lactoylglutathione lyase family enzyme
MSGSSEIHLIQAGPSSSKSKTPDAAASIHLAAIFQPESERQEVTDRMMIKGYEIPEYNEGQGYRAGLARDMDHNLIELVFIYDGAPQEFYKLNQIGLAVSNKDETSAFLRDILGMQAGEISPNPSVSQIHNFTLGTSTIKYFEVTGDTPPHVGSPAEITGLAIVQCIVPDIHSVRSQIAERGGKVHTEPFALGISATIMIVEGPDGILFEFAGPLLERFRE